MVVVRMIYYVCFFKQKTAYEMRISDWSSDVCSSDLAEPLRRPGDTLRVVARGECNHPPCPDVFVERGESVPRAAQLERAHRLEAFGLEGDSDTAPFVAKFVVEQRRRRQDLRDFRRRIAHPGPSGMSYDRHAVSFVIPHCFTSMSEERRVAKEGVSTS